jgi:hypothetical protein
MWPYEQLIHPYVNDFLDRFNDFFDAIEAIPFVETYAADANMYATIESVHVLTVALVVGTIMFVDLRLLGFIGRGNPVRRASKILPYTWWAFVFAVISGLMLWAVAANRHSHNPAFQIKMLLILLAGINMAAFHFGVWRSVDAWDDGGKTPAAARLAGALSLVFWLGALFYGRFTPWVS